jgi:hypothetical protein
MRAYIKRTERSHLKLLEKQEQAKHKRCRRREIIKIKSEIHEIEIINNQKNHTKNQ